MKIYVVNGSVPDRIGTVLAFSTTQLRLPLAYTRSAMGVQLAAVPLGGGQPIAFPRVSVGTDERLVLIVGTSQGMSTFAVYRR